MANSKQALLSYEDPGFINSPDGRLLRIMAEYVKPLAHFRRERIQDTVVFFGSARFVALDEAAHSLELLDTSGSAKRASAEEQPATSEQIASGQASQLQREHAEAAVEMAQYYEDARKLAYLLTQWSMTLRYKRHRFVVTSGGGPGIMEAANRGASEAGGKTIGLNIRLPFEQAPNPYITPSLSLDFHYFFMRKFWFAYLAKALVVFPGGFGTLDEMFELLTLTQTHKLAKEMTIVVYGSQYWNEVINLDTLVKKGTISPEDVKLLHFADTPDDAFTILRDSLTLNHLGGKKPETGTMEELLDEDTEMSLRPEIRKTRP
ncbi:MAG TPA: TIGR00730 family Rossman fold protein [Acidobacteriaceae bacterium]|nr:TIGR00730 family Rossman fold protein [Acidobacteriaceae bacterium]